MEDLRSLVGEIADEPEERRRVDVTRDLHGVERHALVPERPGEVPGAGLVLVQHQEPRVPAALAQPGQEREQVRLGA